MSNQGENDPLLQGDGLQEYTQELKGVTPVASNPRRPMFNKHMSMFDMSNNTSMTGLSFGTPAKRDIKSYSIGGDGTVSYLTPLQMGRQELYEVIPFTAVFGLQKKERNLRSAYASFAADLDVMEASQLASKSNNSFTKEDFSKRQSVAQLMIMDDLELDSVLMTTPLIFAVFVAAISQFLVGYNIGVMNAPEPVVFPGHSTLQWSLAVAAFAVGAPFGANIAGNLADTRGRRGAMMLSMWIFIVGGVLQTFALNMTTLIVSRFIIGFASGFSSVLVPIYLGELAPPTMRGTLGTLTQFSLVTGIFISALAAFPFATESRWRILFAISPMTAIVQLFCAPWLLESPRWLLNKDVSSTKARFIIKKLRGLRNEYEIDTEIDHFTAAMRSQPMKKNSGNNDSDIGFMSMLRNKDIRIFVVTCVVLQMSQQLCGINAVFYYSASIFDGVIANPLVGSTLVSGVNVAATHVALLLMDKYGRRTLLLWSTGGMLVSCVILVLSLLHYFSNMTALIAVNMYVSFFEIGLGPIPFMIVVEMFDAKYVTVAMSASSQLNWVCNFIVGLMFPSLNARLGPYTFGVFAVVLLLSFLFTLIWLPESKGTTAEELEAELVKKNSSSVFHNVSITANSYKDMDWPQSIKE